MGKIVGWGMAALMCAGASWAERAPITVKGERVTLTLGREEKGAVVSLKTAEGVELAAAGQKSPRLFSLSFSQQAQPTGELSVASSADAATFSAEVKEEAGGAVATLTYEGFAKGLARVVCTVRTKPGDAMARWGIRAAAGS